MYLYKCTSLAKSYQPVLPSLHVMLAAFSNQSNHQSRRCSRAARVLTFQLVHEPVESFE